MSELTERLRNRIHDSQMDNEHMMDDAIDALEAQEAKIAALEEAVNECADAMEAEGWVLYAEQLRKLIIPKP